MSAIMFFAAGLFSSRRSDRVAAGAGAATGADAGAGSASPSSPNERGFTLQTLIVTAVLVLLAVGVGVVIVALTGSSSDDFEESGSDLDGDGCNELEIYDPIVAARNEPGSNVALTFKGSGRPDLADPISELTELRLDEFKGSNIGCIPVCVWFDRESSSPGHRDGQLDPGEVRFVREIDKKDILISREANLKFNTGGDFPRTNYFLTSGSPRDEIAFFTREGPLTIIPQPAFGQPGFTVTRYTQGSIHPTVARVAVAPNQSECHTYDEDGNVLRG